MRIVGLYLEGFGHFHGHAIDDLPPGLAILHGPNEAGKSTVLEFVKYVLFGSERGKKPQRLTSGRVGGRIDLLDGDRKLTIERLEGAPVLLRERGSVEEGDEAVRRRLGGLDRPLFQAISGFSLADLEGLKALGDEALRDRLFSGALIGAGRSVAAVRKALADRRARLWRPRTHSEIRDLQRELAEVRKALEDARESARGVGELRRRADDAEADVRACAAAADASRRGVARLLALERAWPRHAAHEEALRACAGLPALLLDAEARGRFAELRLAASEARIQREGELPRVVEARALLAGLRPDAALLAAGGEIAELARLLDAAAADPGGLRPEREAAEARLAEALDAAGLPSVEAMLALRLGAADADRLRALATRAAGADAARARADDARRALALEEAAAHAAAAARDALPLDRLGEAAADEVEELLREAPSARAAAARIAEIDRRIAGIDARIAAGPGAGIGEPEREPLRAAVARWQAADAESAAAARLAGPPDPSPPDPEGLRALALGFDEALAARSRSEAGLARAEALREEARSLAEGACPERAAELADAARAAREARVGRWAAAALAVALLLAGGLALVAGALAGSAAGITVALAGGLLLALAPLLAFAAAILPARRATRWRLALQSAGLPASTPVEDAEALVARLAAAASAAEAARGIARSAHADAPIWESWCRAAGLDGSATAEAARRTLAELQERAGRERQAEVVRALAADAAALHRRARAHATRAGVPEAVPLAELGDWFARVQAVADLREARGEAERERGPLAEAVEVWVALRAALLARLHLPADAPEAAALARCREAGRLRGSWREADEAARAAERRCSVARRALSDAEADVNASASDAAAWNDAVGTAGLPATLSPAAFEGFVEAARRARAAHDDARRLGGAELAAERAIAASIAAAARLAAVVGRPAPAHADAARALGRALPLALELAREEERQRTLAARALEAAEARLAAHERAHDQASDALGGLCAACGADGVEALEAALEGSARRRQLEAAADEAAAARREILGPWADDPGALAELATGDTDGWRAQRAAAEAAARDAEARRDEALRAHTVASERLAAVERSADVARCEMRASALVARLDGARRALLDVVLADRLLDRTLTRFREAHQPAVLQAASAWLARATGGRYVAIEATDDGRDVVVVDEVGGRRFASELSRGTVELVYIVLRLGLAADRARHAVALPLVLDDILVNLDPERAAGLARLLAHVATEHQVLLLTCRPETRDLLLRHDPAARVLELARYGGRSVPVPSRVPPGRRAPPPAPAPRQPDPAPSPQGKQEVLFHLDIPES